MQSVDSWLINEIVSPDCTGMFPSDINVAQRSEAGVNDLMILTRNWQNDSRRQRRFPGDGANTCCVDGRVNASGPQRPSGGRLVQPRAAASRAISGGVLPLNIGPQINSSRPSRPMEILTPILRKYRQSSGSHVKVRPMSDKRAFR